MQFTKSPEDLFDPITGAYKHPKVMSLSGVSHPVRRSTCMKGLFPRSVITNYIPEDNEIQQAMLQATSILTSKNGSKTDGESSSSSFETMKNAFELKNQLEKCVIDIDEWDRNQGLALEHHINPAANPIIRCSILTSMTPDGPAAAALEGFRWLSFHHTLLQAVYV